MNPDVDQTSARGVFNEIKSMFPALGIIDGSDPEIDLSLMIPQQTGLRFPINLGLDGDELHLSAGEAFSIEMFPCTNPEVCRAFRDAVCGLIRGEYRIVESYSFGNAVSAQLQREVSGRWKRTATWARAFSMRVPFFTKRVVLRNPAGE